MTELIKWHWAKMRPLFWFETIVKIAAWFCLIPLLQFFGSWPSIFGTSFIENALTVSLILTALLGFGIIDRILDKEFFALIFILFNVIAHALFSYYLHDILNSPTSFFTQVAKPQEPSIWLLAFCIGMLLGDLIKIIGITLYKTKVRSTPRWVLYFLTLVFMVGYIYTTNSIIFSAQDPLLGSTLSPGL